MGVGFRRTPIAERSFRPPNSKVTPHEFDDAELEDGLGTGHLHWPPLSGADQVRLDNLLQRTRVGRIPGDSTRHHYIPQFYQRRFANSDDQLNVMPIDGRAARVANVEDTAVISNFYTTIDRNVGENVGFETILSELDAIASTIIGDLIDGANFPIEPKDRATLALWIALLHTRDPFTRRALEAAADHAFKLHMQVRQSDEEIREKSLQRYGRIPTPQEIENLQGLVDFIDDFELTPHQNDLVVAAFDAALYSQLSLSQRKMTLIRFREPGLVFSDRPLVVERGLSPLGGLIGSDRLLLPLDRSTALVLYADQSMPDSSMTIASDERMKEINQAQILNAKVDVFCHPSDKDQLSGMEFPDPDQPLLTASEIGEFRIATDGVNQTAQRRMPRRYRRGDSNPDQA